MKLLEKLFIYSMIVIGIALYQLAKRFSNFGIYLHGNRILPMIENKSQPIPKVLSPRTL